MSERVDAVIVGAGVMGAMTAWQLALRGRSVVLLEQYALLHAHGSSHGQTRIMRVAYRDANYTSLAGESLGLWRDLESASNEQLLEQSGQLDHGEPQVIDVIEAGLLQNGWAALRLMPAAATERWPGMIFDRAVVFSPDGGRVFADRSVAAAIRTAERLGAVSHDRTPVERIERTVLGPRVHSASSSWDAGGRRPVCRSVAAATRSRPRAATAAHHHAAATRPLRHPTGLSLPVFRAPPRRNRTARVRRAWTRVSWRGGQGWNRQHDSRGHTCHADVGGGPCRH